MVTATRSTLVNNVLLTLVVVLNALTNVSAFQAQNNLLTIANPANAGFCLFTFRFCMLKMIEKLIDELNKVHLAFSKDYLEKSRKCKRDCVNY